MKAEAKGVELSDLVNDLLTFTVSQTAREWIEADCALSVTIQPPREPGSRHFNNEK